MTCEHPEDQLQPLAFNGVIDVEEWECAACGHWNVKEPSSVTGVDYGTSADHGVLVMNGSFKSASWVPVSSEALEDMGDAFVALREITISMSMSTKDLTDTFAKLSKKTFMITNAGRSL